MLCIYLNWFSWEWSFSSLSSDTNRVCVCVCVCVCVETEREVCDFYTNRMYCFHVCKWRKIWTFKTTWV